MKIERCEKIDVSGSPFYSKCNLFLIHVKIDDVENQASQMIETISSTSWIEKLSIIDKACFEARAAETIKKLANDIFKKVTTSKISESFGEYLVSMSAQDVLESELGHKKLPLAELFKEKKSGNPGFDYHTLTHTNILAFGEAKYSGYANKATTAINQIVRFIDAKKDIMELSDLSKFVEESVMNKVIEGKKAYIAAFSINARYPEKIFENIKKNENFSYLLEYPELYLIGVEVIDTSDSK